MLAPSSEVETGMALHTWWWFLVTVFVLCGTPGPNMLHILGRSVGLGFRGSVPAMAGCLLAMLLVLAASAAGLSAVLHSSPRLFEVLRYLGVAYLAWLGIKAWRDSGRPAPQADDAEVTLAPVHGAGTVFRGGLWVGLSNPSCCCSPRRSFRSSSTRHVARPCSTACWWRPSRPANCSGT